MTSKTYKFNDHFYYQLEKHQCTFSAPVHSVYRPILIPVGLAVSLEVEDGFELVELKGAVKPMENVKTGYQDVQDERFSYLIKPNKKGLAIYFRESSDAYAKVIIEFDDYINGDSGLFFAGEKSFIDSLG